MLRSTAALLVLLAVGVVAGALLLPASPGGGESALLARGKPDTRPTTAVLPSLPEFERVWNRRLRPSFETAVAMPEAAGPVTGVQATVAPAVSGTSVAVVGTIGDSIALIRDAAGNVEARQVGETIAGVGTVVAVRPSEVDLQQNGQRITLRRVAETPEPTPTTPLSMPQPDPIEEPQIGPVVDRQ